MHVVFVHGTGVRDPAFSATFNAVSAGLKGTIPGVHVHPCYWAEHHGSNIGAGRSIPLYGQSMGVGGDDTLADPMNEWALLLDDPLIELRLLALQAGAGGAARPGKTPAVILREQLGKLALAITGPDFSALEDASRPIFLGALAKLLAMPELDGAVNAGVQLAPNNPKSLDAVRLLVARAIVMGWICQLLDAGMPSPGGATRDTLIDATYCALGGERAQTMGLGKNLLNVVLAPMKIMLRTVVVNPTMRMAAWGGRTYRHTIANAATPAAGDILLYQARGKPIRDYILATASAIGEPVVLLAHSLGGIACIDLLLEQEHSCIKGVITAGSQAPFLFEIGALSQLDPGKEIPPHMPPWLNIYDRDDLLSFLAAPLMKANNAVTDIEVRSGQPFPAAHSAYWSNPAVWEHCAHFIRQL